MGRLPFTSQVADCSGDAAVAATDRRRQPSTSDAHLR